ncbi:DUF421 domain-containing protein [Variovorax sp. M-6]|uniref:DUF421 domain-containing protein n=1 Tax=Variovorax sp. M-6 TaxID=3233041 RepID=UPI003F95132C
MAWIKWLFGEGSDLEIWQMTARAVVMFFIALLFIRASGRRSFGQHTPFDACVTVLLGAVLSRAVVGASPFWATVAAGAALVLVHRALSIATGRWPHFEDIVSGREVVIISHGQLNRRAMLDALLTERNLCEAVRQKLGSSDFSRVALAILERDGKITVIESEAGDDSRR